MTKSEIGLNPRTSSTTMSVHLSSWARRASSIASSCEEIRAGTADRKSAEVWLARAVGVALTARFAGFGTADSVFDLEPFFRAAFLAEPLVL